MPRMEFSSQTRERKGQTFPTTFRFWPDSLIEERTDWTGSVSSVSWSWAHRLKNGHLLDAPSPCPLARLSLLKEILTIFPMAPREFARNS